MTTALIFAGGTGKRMNSRAKPKQFLELHGKPVIIYTIERFEEHAEIENIVVVCIESWINELKHLLNRYDIHKVSKVVKGGDTGHQSIYNGLLSLTDECDKDDIVLIHDGVRPLINADLISENICKTRVYNAVITVDQVSESVVRVSKDKVITEVPTRSEMYSAKAPQSFKYGFILDLYGKADKDNLLTIDSAHLCSIYGADMHTVQSSPNNIKITEPQDYYVFRALYEAMENQQIIGV